MDEDTIKMQSKNIQVCIACAKNISLSDKLTYMCSKCKLYFCEECAIFYNNNSLNTVDNCPGGKTDPHESIMVRITRTIKEYAPLGVSIEKLESNKKTSQQSKSTIKILTDTENDLKNTSKEKNKPKFKILED